MSRRRGASGMRAMTILTILGILVALLIPVLASRRAKPAGRAPGSAVGEVRPSPSDAAPA
ncbi:MAG TPA: hypothetical protein VFV33_27645 [Gemmatimonadaceae bacterium]|nr:hypothetical protein [Gemmatimonadaceae bacterium]